MARISVDRATASAAAQGIVDSLPKLRAAAARFPGGVAAGVSGTEAFDTAFNDATSALADTLPAAAGALNATAEAIRQTAADLIGADQRGAAELKVLDRAF